MSFLETIAQDRVLLGAVVLINLLMGAVLLWQQAARFRTFLATNHRAWLDTRQEYRDSLDDAAVSCCNDKIVMEAILWQRLCRILSNFLYLIVALASLPIVRLSSKFYEGGELFADVFAVSTLVFMGFSAIVVTGNVFEINHICRKVLVDKTGSDRGF